MICLSLCFSLIDNVVTNVMEQISVKNAAAFLITILFTIF